MIAHERPVVARLFYTSIAAYMTPPFFCAWLRRGNNLTIQCYRFIANLFRCSARDLLQNVKSRS